MHYYFYSFFFFFYKDKIVGVIDLDRILRQHYEDAFEDLKKGHPLREEARRYNEETHFWKG